MADFLAAKAITPATARNIMSGKRPQKYKKDDIAASAVLHSISPKAFKLIRKKGWMQLPSVSTVAYWLREFKLKEGIQCKLLDIVRAKHPDPAAKEAFISFDEMALKACWVYDKVPTQLLLLF